MPAIDDFLNSHVTDFPASSAAAVTPHDTNELSHVSRGLWIGSAGDVKVTMRDGQAVTYSNALAGTMLPLRVKIVWSTGTTASSIVSVW